MFFSAASLSAAQGLRDGRGRTLRRRGERSNPARRDVAIHLSLAADENDAVTGRVAPVPFHFLVRYIDTGAARDDAFAIRNDRYIMIAIDLERIGLEGVRLAATGHVGIVGLHQALKPLTHIDGRVVP